MGFVSFQPGQSLTGIRANGCNRIKVEDTWGIVKNPLLAWTCIRLDRLRPGYRFIRLMDLKGNWLPGGKLLVKVEKKLRLPGDDAPRPSILPSVAP